MIYTIEVQCDERSFKAIVAAISDILNGVNADSKRAFLADNAKLRNILRGNQK